MKVRLVRADVTYEVSFRKPLFELLTGTAAAVEAIHSALAPTYALTLADIQVVPSTTAAGVAVRTTLFAGLASLDIWVDRYQASFQKLQSRNNFEVAKSCGRLFFSAIRKYSGERESKTNEVLVSSWLACEGGNLAVKSYLFAHRSRDIELDKAKLGIDDASYVISARVTNKAEGWAVSFLLETSQLDAADLYFKCHAVYIEGGRFSTFEERVAHVENMYRLILENVGIQLVDSMNV